MTPFDQALQEALAAEAFSLHLTPGEPPRAQLGEGMVALSAPPLDGSALVGVARRLFGAARVEGLNGSGWIVAHHRIDDKHSVRATLSLSLGVPSLDLAFRIPGPPLPLEALQAPPELESLLTGAPGLLLLAGPPGSGRPTTFYALLERLNGQRTDLICTVEDPVHQVLRSGRSLVRQAEVGSDVPDVAGGIAAALAKGAAVLAVSAPVDAHALRALVAAAEAGLLVLVSLPAPDARAALLRVVRAEQADRVGPVLLGVLGQRLLPALPRGRVAAYELMLADDQLREALREGRPLEEVSGAPGSMALGEAIDALEAGGRISAEVAASARQRR